MDFKTIISLTANQCGEDQNRIRLILSSFFDVVKSEIASGEKVKIPQFGEFTSKVYQSRTIVSPFSDGPKKIPPRYSVKFKPSATLKNQVQDGY